MLTQSVEKDGPRKKILRLLPPVSALLSTLLLIACSNQDAGSVEAQLSPTLEAKGFGLHRPDGIVGQMYGENAPDVQSNWFETDAILLYEASLGKTSHLYALAYDAPYSKQQDSQGNNIYHVTHLLKTHLPFPRQQPVTVRYLREAPLLFEWAGPIAMCPAV